MYYHYGKWTHLVLCSEVVHFSESPLYFLLSMHVRMFLDFLGLKVNQIPLTSSAVFYRIR